MKLGIFCGGELMIEYPPTNEGYREALIDAKLAFEESGIPQEIKFIDDEGELK